jgi:hypothetical protein
MFVTEDTIVSFLATLMACTTHSYHTPEDDLVLRANGRWAPYVRTGCGIDEAAYQASFVAAPP